MNQQPPVTKNSAKNTPNLLDAAPTTQRFQLLSILSILGSMPVAISMLCLVALSSVIGTILQQQQNYVDYVNRFGSWWTDIFIALSLNQIYSSTWFLLILTFLCISTSVCITRSWPPFYRQIQKYQLNVKKKFLLEQKFSTTLKINSCEYLLADLKRLGYQTRIKEYTLDKDTRDVENAEITGNTKNTENAKYIKNKTTLIAAKKNAHQKWGYLLTHIAVLVISIGGLFDGNLPLKWRLWTGENQTLKSYENTWQEKNILSETNPSFRANLWVAEGDKSNFSTIRLTDGILGQRLPFEVELKKFHIDYYSSGMPKSFISDVVLRAKNSQESKVVQLKVNQPAEFMGYRLYQSSFEDGGSKLDLRPVFWKNASNNLDVETNTNTNVAPTTIQQDNLWRITTQDKPKISINHQNLQFEISEFKAINVHRNIVENANHQSQSESKQALNRALISHIDQREFKNIGPSLQYKLRGDDQKAIEYHSYMLPIEVEGYPSFIIGMREKNDMGFQYVYVPSFEGKSLEWQALSQSFFNAQTRQTAILEYAKKYPAIEASIISSLKKASLAFLNAQNEQKPGLMGLASMVQGMDAQQKNMGPILMHMFQGMMWEVWRQSRIQRGLEPIAETPAHTLFVQKAMTAISDIPLIKSPVWFELKNFDQKNASVLQITRSPGQAWVYLGCVMLVIGVFMMLFMQELRLWIYLEEYQDLEQLAEKNAVESPNIVTAVIAMARARHLHSQTQSFNQLIEGIKTNSSDK